MDSRGGKLVVERRGGHHWRCNERLRDYAGGGGGGGGVASPAAALLKARRDA